MSSKIKQALILGFLLVAIGCSDEVIIHQEDTLGSIESTATPYEKALDKLI